MMQLFSLLSIFLSMMFLLESSPLFLSLIIITQIITLALIISLFTMSSWFSFMLMMIYLSGMMIVFIYVSSMASNELFYINTRMLPLFLIMSIVFTFLFFNSDMQMPSNSLNFLDLNLTQISTLKTMKMYSKSLFMMTILLIIYLLFAMIMVVKNSSFSSGPLRSAK
uniref:NADH-ubiquinone oxidoreductase chain 6 n=1 Tax=Pseudoniphargus longipes TaxID=2211511 RepID=A0A345UDS1_9CRUS|nr:NADH dehydrogenase subunit 6 [Pseudoniphargus longipes]